MKLAFLSQGVTVGSENISMNAWPRIIHQEQQKHQDSVLDKSSSRQEFLLKYILKIYLYLVRNGNRADISWYNLGTQ